MSKLRNTGTLHFGRLWAFGILSLLFVAALALGGAHASTSTKYFTAGIVQTGQWTYGYTLTNDPSSSQTLGSAQVKVPTVDDYFSSVSVPETPIPVLGANGSPVNKQWTAEVRMIGDEQVIELKANSVKNALAPGQSLPVTITFTSTQPCSGTPYDWSTAVKQSNNFSGAGNDFVPLSDTPSSKVAGALARYNFAPIGPQVVGTSFTAEATARDVCNNVVVYHGGSAALSGLRGGAADRTLSFANGAAAAQLTPTLAQVDARLTLTHGTNTDASNPFTVFVVCTSASSAANCLARGDDGTTVSAQPPTTANGKMELSLAGTGRQISCDGAQYAAFGSLALVVPENYARGVAIPIAITVPLAGAPPGSRAVCLSKDDGETYETVSKCTGRTPAAPCELGRTRTGDMLEIRFLIDPEDPWVGVR